MLVERDIEQDQRDATQGRAATGASTGTQNWDGFSVVAVLIASISLLAALVCVGITAREASRTQTVVHQGAPAASTGAEGVQTAAAAPLGVTEHDFAITPDKSSIPEGLIDVNGTDNGPTAHELLIFQTDLAPDHLPLGSDGRVDELGDGVQKVFDSGADIDVGTTKSWHTALAAGHYVLICNLPGHYKAGMHAAVTVTPSAAPATKFATTEHDFAITPARTSLPAGLVDLNVTDNGPTAHELLIFQTDLAPDHLPLGSDGRVDELGDGVQKVFDSGADIDVGTTKSWHTALAAGHYVLICNLPGHYKAGMHTLITVG